MNHIRRRREHSGEEKMKYLKAVLVILALIFATSSTAGANLVVNGGFETGDLSGWTRSGGTGSSLYADVYRNPVYNPSYPKFAFPVHSGTYHLRNEYTFNWQYITQNIITTPGQSYAVDFWLADADIWADAVFRALWNGTEMIYLYDINRNTMPYTYFSYTGVATGSLTTIEFGFRFNPLGYGLDDISVNAVPIPGAIWLLGSGLIGLIGMRRKFRK